VPESGPSRRGPDERGWRTSGIFFGSLLVVVGLVALFGGLTSIFDLLRLWPLLIVVGGLARMFRPRREALVKRFAEGLGSVAVGLVLLGNTLGFIRWSVWIALLSLWPLLVIAIGIELVGKGLHIDWLRALSNVVLILGLAYGVLVLQYAPGTMLFPFGSFGGPAVSFAQEAPHDPTVLVGSASVKVGATALTLEGGDALASVSGHAPSADQPKLATSSEASRSVTVAVSEPGDRAVFLAGGTADLDVKLDRGVQWGEVRLDVGAVSGSVDLSGLKVQRVVVNAGASDLTLTVGDFLNNVDVQVSGGAMSLTVRVPASAACTVQATSGLTEVRVPPDFRRTSGIPVVGGSTFVSSGTASPTIAVTLTSGVSDIRIETY
jgi:hypothetical protein